MSGRFQSLRAAAVLLISTVVTLAGAPAVAREIGSDIGSSTGQDHKPGTQPVTPPRARTPYPPIITPEPPPGYTPPPRPTLITNPTWQRAATPVYPAAALANGVTEGAATLRCDVLPDGRLSDCVVVDESPPGQGFGEAVLAAARRSRLSPRVVDGAAVGAKVQFTTRFIAPVGEPASPPSPEGPLTITAITPVPVPASSRSQTLPAGVVPAPPPRPAPPPQRPSSVITAPSWARQPQPEFPATASANDVATGVVTLQCAALPDGALSDCQVIEETPTGQGFADSAIAATQRARFSPRTVHAASQGARVQFTVRFVEPLVP